MARLEEQMVEVINRPSRIGVLATTDRKGQPNLAYFGSGKLQPEGDLIMTLADNRTLDNLEHNPNAVFLAIKESPVTLKTPGWRLYLKVSKILRDGEVLESERNHIAQIAGAKVAETIIAAVIFDITEVRPLVG